MSDVVVVGAGLAGLVAALRLRGAGASVTLATSGVGGLPLSQGSLDVLGYVDGARVDRPYEAFDRLGPDHPYACIGADAVREGVAAVADWCPDQLVAPDGANHVIPTATGVLRPTAVVPRPMAGGDRLATAERVLVVGIRQLKDFYAAHMAANLQHSCAGAVRYAEVDYVARAGEADPSGVAIARSLDEAAGVERLADAVRPHVEPGDVVVLPAVLGSRDAHAWSRLAGLIGADVVESLCLPPSVPGIRLDDHLVTAVKRARARWILGSPVCGGTFDGDRLTSLTLFASGSPRELRGDAFVLATGGFESGGLRMDSRGVLSEPVLDLPVWAPDGDLVHDDYLGREMPLFRAGLRVDEHMRPLRDGVPVATNLYAVGGLLAGAMRWSEKSGEGIAVGSAWKATHHILEERP